MFNICCMLFVDLSWFVADVFAVHMFHVFAPLFLICFCYFSLSFVYFHTCLRWVVFFYWCSMFFIKTKLKCVASLLFIFIVYFAMRLMFVHALIMFLHYFTCCSNAVACALMIAHTFFRCCLYSSCCCCQLFYCVLVVFGVFPMPLHIRCVTCLLFVLHFLFCFSCFSCISWYFTWFVWFALGFYNEFVVFHALFMLLAWFYCCSMCFHRFWYVSCFLTCVLLIVHVCFMICYTYSSLFGSFQYLCCSLCMSV